MKQLLVLLLIVASENVLHGQSPINGEIFPYKAPLLFKYEIKKQAAISEFKGQYVIVDLFASSCIACFKAMPKIQRLQEYYHNKIRFLLVGKKDAHIESVYEKIRSRNKFSLPVAFDSSIFRALAVESVPYCIWINPDGTVYNVTTSEEVNQENIELFLSGRPFQSSKQIAEIPFDPYKPMLMYGNGGPDSVFMMRSILAKYKAGQRIYSPSAISPNLTSFQITGASFSDLCMLAVIGSSFWQVSHSYYGTIFPRTIIDPEDSMLAPKGLFNYSITVPESLELRKKMLEDLERTFGWTAEIETGLMPCWNLILLNNDTARISAKDTIYNDDISYGGIHVRSFNINWLIEALNIYNPNEDPIINCTGMSGKVDIDIDALLSDLSQVRRELKNSGVDLIKSQKRMKVVVLKKIK